MTNMNDHKRLLLPGYDPLTWLYLAVTIYISCILISTWLIIQQPYLGLGLMAIEGVEGLQVSAINKRHAGKLKVGDQLVAITAKGYNKQFLSALSVMEEPDNFQTYAPYNEFIAHQRALYNILSQRLVTVILADGQTIELPVARSRPFNNLPVQYWILLIAGGICLFIGLWIWVFRRGEIVSRLIVLGGFGYMLGACCLAVYINRELVIAPNQFKVLSGLNHLGNYLFLSSSAVVVCYYPNKIAKIPFVFINYAVMIGVLLNEYLQMYELPIHTFYLFPLFVIPALGGFFGYRQWQIHANNPVVRASMRWFLLTLLLCISTVLALYFVPTLFQESPLMPAWGAQVMVLMIYIGLVLGVIQYRLFDVEKWWFNCWTWFFSGCALIAMDMLLIYLFNMTPLQSISIAVLLIAWLYFPVRQWLWSKTLHPQCINIENFFPLITESYISSPSIRHFETSWPDLLVQIYRPLSVKLHANSVDVVSLEHQGLSIILPSLNNLQHIELYGLQRGGKLFSMQDVHFIESALVHARRCISWKSMREEGAKQERERIRRDLHDDVGALLLTLVHKAESDENAQLARNALKGVRDSIYSLGYDNFSTLNDSLCEWHVEIKQRTSAADIGLQWHINELSCDYSLSPRQRINLERILREAITNILKHAQAQAISFGINENRNKLQILITDDGNSSDYTQWQANTGLYSLQTRAQEIGAELLWTSFNNSTALDGGTMLTITLPTLEKNHAFHPDCR